MRFGIMATQIKTLIPQSSSPDAVMNHLATYDQVGQIRQLLSQGFNPIELGGDLRILLPHILNPDALAKLAAFKDELGASYTVHLPLWSVEPSTPQAPVREGSVRALIECIELTRPLEPEVYVLHATGALAAEFYRMKLPDIAKSFLLQLFLSKSRQSIQTVLERTGLPSRKLAIETIEFPFELTWQLAEELDLSICLDIGHVLVGFSGPVDLFDVLEQCLPRLAEIHLHDGPWQGPERNIGYGRDHQALGHGDLDVGRLLDRLQAANFTGPIIFELSSDEALESLAVIRSIRPELLA